MSKKTESIEFRLSPELKEDLSRRVAADGQTMSGYLRDLVSAEMAGGGPHVKGDPEMKTTLNSPLPRMALMALPVVLLAGGYVVSSGMTAGASPDARIAFVEMDANGDGVISEAEFLGFGMEGGMDIAPLPAACDGTELAQEYTRSSSQEMLREELARIDVNADQALSYEELAASMQRDMAEMFLELDLDANGVVTVDELVDAGSIGNEDLFEQDHQLLAEDMGVSLACVEALAVEEPSEPLVFWTEGEEEGEEEDLSQREMARLFVAEFDQNRDGHLTLSEVIGD